MLRLLLPRRLLGTVRNSHVTQKPFSLLEIDPIHELFHEQLLSLPSTSEVEQCVQDSSLLQYNGQNCVTALQLLQRSTHKPALDVVLKACGKMDFSHKELAEVCFGVARNSAMFPQIPESLVRQVATTSDWNQYSTFNLIVLLKAFALARQKDSAILGRIYETSLEKEFEYERCQVDDLAMLLSGFAQFRYGVPRLCDSVAEYLVSTPALMQAAKFPHTALLVDSFARLGHPSPRLFALVAATVVDQTASLAVTGRDVMRLLKGFAALGDGGDDNDELYKVLGLRLEKLDATREFSIPLLTSFAVRETIAPSLADWFATGIAHHLSSPSSKWKPVDLSLLLSSMVKLNVPGRHLVEQEIASRELHSFTDLDLHTIAPLLLAQDGELRAKLVAELERRKHPGISVY
ncbi:hypothetical protein BASA81_015162 [Batrachochytrium salamandrivorans]|nr:hypothetical protein BASA81_015162 [Batrachochytrium salamandrivorans]